MTNALEGWAGEMPLALGGVNQSHQITVIARQMNGKSHPA